jgi:gliding motility-associated-like protein
MQKHLFFLFFTLMIVKIKAQGSCTDTMRINHLYSQQPICVGTPLLFSAQSDTTVYNGAHLWEQSFDNGNSWQTIKTTTGNNLYHTLPQTTVWLRAKALTAHCQLIQIPYKFTNIGTAPSVTYDVVPTSCDKGGLIIVKHDTSNFVYEVRNASYETSFLGNNAGTIIKKNTYVDTIFAQYSSTYTLDVRNTQVCQSFISVYLPNNDGLKVDLKVDDNCNGPEGATLTAMISGGTPPYKYGIYEDATNVTPLTPKLTNLKPNRRYVVSVLDTKGCWTSASFNFHKNVIFHEDLIKSRYEQPSCMGNTSGLIDLKPWNGNEPFTYQWSNGAMTQDLPRVDSKGKDKLFVTVTDAKGCSGETEIYLFSHKTNLGKPRPKFSVVEHCLDTMGVYLTPDEPSYYNPNYYAYRWSNGSTSANLTHLTQGGKYSVTMTYRNSPTCDTVMSFTVNPEYKLDVRARYSEPICYTTQVVTLTEKSYKGISIFWDDGSREYRREFTADAKHKVYFSDLNHCKDTLDINVKIKKPSITLDYSKTICENTTTGYIKVTNTKDITEPRFIIGGKYLAFDRELNNLKPGTYTITVVDRNWNCTIDSTITIGSTPSSFSLSIAPKDTLVYDAKPIKLIAKPSKEEKGYTYKWQPDIGLKCDTCAMTIASIRENQQYKITVKDRFGCVAEDSLTVRAKRSDIYFPTAFSPNGDQNNDTWDVVVVPDIKEIVSCRIYDRWGELLFEQQHLPSGTTLSWNGIFRQKAEQQNIFTYNALIELYDGTFIQRQGDILLME